MNQLDQLLSIFNSLPDNLKQEILYFAEFLHQKELEATMDRIIDEDIEALKELGK